MTNQGQSKPGWLQVTIGIWVEAITISLVLFVSWHLRQKFYVIPRAKRAAEMAKTREDTKRHMDRFMVEVNLFGLEKAEKMHEENDPATYLEARR